MLIAEQKDIDGSSSCGGKAGPFGSSAPPRRGGAAQLPATTPQANTAASWKSARA